MTVFRYSRDVYGQQVLEGISWDMIWVFVGASTLIIAAHLLYSLLRGKTRKPRQ